MANQCLYKFKDGEQCIKPAEHWDGVCMGYNMGNLRDTIPIGYKRTKLYFDGYAMAGVCVGDEGYSGEYVDNGIFEYPSDYSPIGVTAKELVRKYKLIV